MRRRWVTWLKRIVLGALGLVVLAVIGVVIGLHTDWGRERLRRLVVRQLADTFPGGFRIGRLDGSVLGELIARDVEIDALDGRPMVRATTLRIDVGLVALLGKTVRLHHVVGEDVTLYLPRAPIPDRPPDPAPSSWSVEAPDLRLDRARLVYDGAARPVTLERISLAGALAVPAGGSLSAAAQVRGTWRERAAPFDVIASVRLDAVPVVPALQATIGGVTVSGHDLALDPVHPRGTLAIGAPAAAVTALVPSLVLPSDVSLALAATRAGRDTAVELTGALGRSPISGALRIDLEAMTVRGVVSARDLALATVTARAVSGRGSATVAIVAEWPGARAAAAPWARARGTVIVDAAVDGAGGGVAVIGFDAALDARHQLERASALVLAAGAGGGRARSVVALSRKPIAGATEPALVIDRAAVVASVTDAGAATAQRVPVTGRVSVDAAITNGTLAPTLSVAFDGHVAGTRLGYADLGVARLAATYRGTVSTARGKLVVTAHAAPVMRGVTRAGQALGAVRAVADTSIVGGAPPVIRASVTAYPAAVPVEVVADAVVTPGAVIRVALGRHRVRLPSGEVWSGRGGRVAIATRAVTLRGLRTTNRGGHLAVEAAYDRLTGDLSAALEADAVAAASIDPAYRGTASGAISVARRHRRWEATAELAAHELVLRDDGAAIDGDVFARLDGRRLTVAANAAAATLGAVGVELDVDGPRDITDVAAWQALERTAIRSTTITLRRVDLSGVAVPTGGIVDGTIFIAGADTNGTLTVGGIRTPLGEVDGDIAFRPAPRGELGAAWTAHVVGLGDADVTARIAFPDHPFDPAAWRQLGRGALGALSVSLDDVTIDPGKLAALGIVAPYRGTANLELALSKGSTSARAEVMLSAITGGPVVQPVDVELVAETDATGTTAAAHVFASNVAVPSARLELVSVDARLPITFDRWLAAPDRAIYAPIAGRLALAGRDANDQPRPALPARAVLAVLGRTDLANGTLDGEATIGGTLGTPTATGTFHARRIAVTDRIERREVPELELLTVKASWGGVSGSVVITGNEAGATAARPRTITVTASGRPSDLATIAGTVELKQFELAPVAAFLPGPLVAAQGTLDAAVTVRGVHAAGTLRGTIDLVDGRVPLGAVLGTLTGASARLRSTDQGLTARLTGTLGAGTIEVDASSASHDLSAIDATAKLANVSPISGFEPAITATVAGKLQRTPDHRWLGKVAVRGGSVVVPPTSGAALLVADQPEDLYFVDGGRAAKPPMFAPPLGGRPPARPRLVVDVDLGSTQIRADDLYNTRGEVVGRLRILVGESVGVDGTIDIVRGDVGDLFGRSYRADGRLVFDGTTDPNVDITLSHAFPAMVLTANLTGRLSNPNRPVFGGDPIYTQDQLAGFFLGGEPGGDPTAQTREAATGAAASLLQSSKLGRRLRKSLPGKISLLRCEPGGSAVGASCTAGRWIGDRLFVAGKLRLDPRPQLENTVEAQVQYYLQRELLLEGVGGDGNHNGVDLLWRRRW